MPRPSVREKIVEAALDRFQDQGFNGCGVQDITDAACVPKGSFYNHFKSKEALAIEVLERYGEGNRFDLLEDETRKPLERLRAHFDFLADRFDNWHFARGCLLANFSVETADTSPAMRAAMAAAFVRWNGRVADVLRKARDAGEIAADSDVETLARFLVQSWEGAVTAAKVMKTRRPLEDFFGFAFGTLLTHP